MTTFTDTGLLGADLVQLPVFATDSVGDSAPSATRTVTTLPAAPTGLTAAVVSGGQVNLSWTDHSFGRELLLRRAVGRRDDLGPWSVRSPGRRRTLTRRPGRSNGSATYSFRVRASAYYNNYSTYAGVASVTTPAFPSRADLGHRQRRSRTTAVVLAWGDVAGEAGFRVDRSTDNGTTWSRPARSAPG